jgi:hypothetical protein
MPLLKSSFHWYSLVPGLFLAGLFFSILMPLAQASAAGRHDSLYPPLSVVINEVAWSGTVSDSQGTWIELYNPGEVDIDLQGWKLVAADGEPEILLSKVIHHGEYFLLERSDDTTISNIPADLVYVGDLGTENETLLLLGPDESMVDSANLVGNVNWPGGSAFPNYASMERISVVADSPSAWGTNNGLKMNGLDFRSKPIRGTPGQLNSLSVPPVVEDTNTPEPTATLTKTPTRTASPTPTPPAPIHLVISQFRTRGPLGADDEFIELYNPSNVPVNISGWLIKKSSDCGQVIVDLLTIRPGVVLLPGQRFLAASQSSKLESSDQMFSLAIADGGGLALVQPNGNIVDQVGLCASTQFREGLPLPPLIGDYNQGYARKPVSGIRGCQDTNRNENDFYALLPSEPRGMETAPSLCPGVPTAVATTQSKASLTPTAGVAMLTINEFLPRPGSDWNGDGKVNVEDEFIEIINIGTQPVNLEGWKLDDDEGGSNPFFLPKIILLRGEVVVFYGSETGLILNDIGDKVRLMRPNSQIMDFYTYPTVTEPDKSWCRLPDGTGAWKSGCQPSPDRNNIGPGGEGEPPLPELLPEVETPPEESFLVTCPFAEPLTWESSQPICNGWGLGLFNWNFWGPEEILLLPEKDKWGLWIQ